MDKTTLWFIAGFVALVVIVVIVAGVMSGGFDTGTKATTTPPGFVATVVPPITSADWTRGTKNATVSLIEYGDYECPACAEYEPIVQQLLKDFDGRVTFSFRNFPLYSIHPDAGISAQAAEAAGLQGKFWEMHDLLYAKQSDWSNIPPASVVAQKFDSYASSLGLDVNKFNSDIVSSKVGSKIQTDVQTANAALIDHTPTYFVNMKQIPNPGSYKDFKAVIDAALGIVAEPLGTPSVTVSSTPNVTSTHR